MASAFVQYSGETLELYGNGSKRRAHGRMARRERERTHTQGTACCPRERFAGGRGQRLPAVGSVGFSLTFGGPSVAASTGLPLGRPRSQRSFTYIYTSTARWGLASDGSRGRVGMQPSVALDRAAGGSGGPSALGSATTCAKERATEAHGWTTLPLRLLTLGGSIEALDPLKRGPVARLAGEIIANRGCRHGAPSPFSGAPAYSHCSISLLLPKLLAPVGLNSPQHGAGSPI